MNEITIEMRRETIEDIVSAIRERAGIGFDMGRPEMMDLADRIETAAKATVVTDNTETMHNLLAEIARLKAALKPILECEDTVMDTGDGHTLAWYAEYEKSVDEAKRIYKEGAHE